MRWNQLWFLNIGSRSADSSLFPDPNPSVYVFPGVQVGAVRESELTKGRRTAWGITTQTLKVRIPFNCLLVWVIPMFPRPSVPSHSDFRGIPQLWPSVPLFTLLLQARI